MSTLKTLRDRRNSIQSTQKITLAMKMVAGAKLRRAQEHVEAGRPYTHLMQQILHDLAISIQILESPQPLLTGTGKTDIHLIIIATSDRGLCGSFNSSIIRYAQKIINNLQKQGKIIKICCVGRKGKELLSQEYGSMIIESFIDVGYPRLRFSDVQSIVKSLLEMFDEGIFDICTIVYNRFKSILIQEAYAQQIIPIDIILPKKPTSNAKALKAICEFEPTEEEILNHLLPQNVAIQVYNALLENAASEQGARMTAMDSASRNASDMIRKLTLAYNRTRQAHITRELIEIISGAEAL